MVALLQHTVRAFVVETYELKREKKHTNLFLDYKRRRLPCSACCSDSVETAAVAAVAVVSRLIRFSSSAGRVCNGVKMALTPAFLRTVAKKIMALGEILSIMLLVACCCRWSDGGGGGTESKLLTRFNCWLRVKLFLMLVSVVKFLTASPWKSQ